jgi:hypothetical protein
MRRTIRVPVVAVLTIVAVLGVMVGIGIGQTANSHGGTPTDVYMQTYEVRDEPCAAAGPDGVTVMPQQFSVEEPSHVLALFRFDWVGLTADEVGVSHLELDGTANVEDSWTIAPIGPRLWVAHETLMWTFPNVAPGMTHTVSVYAGVYAPPPPSKAHGDLYAAMENCAMTVFVMPVE